MKIPEYESIEQKRGIFGHNKYQQIDTIDDLNKLIQYTKKKKYVYRGMSEAKYKNYTSAQRQFIVNDLASRGVSIDIFIQKQIEKLQRHKNSSTKNLLPRLYESLGVIPSDILYLSFAQHYGGISPLLDVSRNILIAMYFMSENSQLSKSGDDGINNYFALYYLPVNDYSQNIKFTNKDKIISCLKYDNLKIKSPLIIPDKSLIVTNPKNKYQTIISLSNLNIIRQEGGFIFFTNENPLKPLEEELYCVDIHKSLATYIQELLKSKGLTTEYLFPTEKSIAEKSIREVLCDL